jgi:2',3'-cyclic-nucleotide 2'-phosphodiesterase (5'-nucleotidase family)
VKTTHTLTKRALIGASAVVAIAAAVLTPIAQAATYAAPSAPTKVVATETANGITVSWTPSTAVLPEITSYIVSAGPASCPVIVPATSKSVVTLPVLAGQKTFTPTVQAVNAYGISTAAKANKSFDATKLTVATISTRYKSLQFLQLSDLHGAIDVSSTSIGVAGLVASWNNDRVLNPNTVAVTSGDNIGAAPQISSAFEELPTIEALNLMKVDASTFGNHEHDRDIAHVQKVIGASDFQWVVSNYSSLKDLVSGSKSAKTYTIVTRGGVKIGIVGQNTESTVEQVFPGNLKGASGTITIDPGVAGINKAIADARAAGAQVVIALVHQGWTENVDGVAVGRFPELAEQIKGANIIYGGHSHLTYSSAVPGSVRTPAALVAEVRNAGVEYTRTTLCLDTQSGRVKGSAVEYIQKADAAKLTPDAAGTALVKKYKDQLAPKLDVKIGTVNGVFPRGGSPAVERSGETPLGNFTADAIRAKYKTDFVFLNGGGIRDTFPAKTYVPLDKTLVRPTATVTTGTFDVTVGDAMTVFPFGNSVSTTTITGTLLWKALENGVGGAYPADGRFPQISGFKFSFDSSKPLGSRVVSVTKLDGTPIAKDSTVYTVATLDYVVQGGDGYVGVFSPATAKVRDLLVDVFIEAVKNAKEITIPAADGRTKKVG